MDSASSAAGAHAAPDTCEVVVAAGSLPATGGPDATAVLVISLAIVLTGVAMMMLARRRRRAALMATGALAALLVLAPTAGPVAVAAPAETGAAGVSMVGATGDAPTVETTYGEGCTLLRVGDLVIDPRIGDLLPGDAATLIEGTVTNRFEAPVLLTGSVRFPEASPLTAALHTELRLAGTDGPALVAPGTSVRVELAASLPASVGDHLQGMLAPLELVLTGVQQ